MASIPGAALNITGTSGSNAGLVAKQGWRAYVFPRGGHASQDSSGTLITFDSAAVASRFVANNWIQVGLNTANIRKVSAVGGNSLSVSGAAVTVTTNDRVFLIGNTQPSVSGGSATYIIPASTIRQRDDAGATIFTNSMVTSNVYGLVQFWSAANFYDVLIQDGNQSNQGSIIDLSLGMAEGVDTNQVSVFGATVTINSRVGITGSVVIQGSLIVTADIASNTLASTGNATVGGLLDATGRSKFGSTATFNTNIGVTGTATFEQTATFNGQAVFGSTITVNANVTTTGDIYFRRLIGNRGTTVTGVHWELSGWGAGSTISVANGSNDTQGSAVITAGSAASMNALADFTFADGAYAFPPWFIAVRSSVGSNDQPGVAINGNPLSTTQARVVFYGATPTNIATYVFRWLTIGDKN
jgi:hypothetical protein